MTEFRCASCKEIQELSPRAKYCPICGSSSLIPVDPPAPDPVTTTDDYGFQQGLPPSEL